MREARTKRDLRPQPVEEYIAPRATSNVENQLISKIIETGDLITVVDEQLAPRFFSGSHKRAYEFITIHHAAYGTVPNQSTFETKFPHYILVDAPEPITYYCTEVRTKRKHNTLVDAVEEASELIAGLDTEGAYNVINRAVLNVENEVHKSDRKEVNQNARERYDAMLKRRTEGGISGIPTGIGAIDLVLRGSQGGELHAIVGYTGTGKSWHLVIEAVHAARDYGVRVLIGTTEMSVDMMIRRVDAVWNGLGYTRFLNGTLTPTEEKRFLDYVERVEDDEFSTLIVEQLTGGVNQLAAKIEQHKPDIVFVDGAYLLEDDFSGGKEDDWKATVRIFRDLHKLALAKKIPIKATTQSKERKISLDTLSFARALANECDVVTAIEQDDQMAKDRESLYKFLKIREGASSGSILRNWDFHEMDYSVIYTEGGDPVPITDTPQGVSQVQ